MAKRKKKSQDEGSGANPLGWMMTYGDMVTLLLCFFAILFNPVETREEILHAVSEYFTNMGWGHSLTVGRMADSGNVIAEMPSQTRGRQLADAMIRAVSIFHPEVQSNRVRITHDERGVVISFASDIFFNQASANINVEASRSVLMNLAILLTSEEVAGRRFRIEGHTDDSAVDPGGRWESNWQLSTERALSVLYFLANLGVSESRMQIAGFADTMPMSSNDTDEGRANNRRVDIIIIDDAHL
ncbi:MAG: flagellar motor protein MotB [Treponema sp.]|nr:flagellar motor protein MotB [Treponema sp.]